MRKFFIIGACLCALAPSFVMADIIQNDSQPFKILPQGENISSLVKKIVQYGDLRDAQFIAKLMGLSWSGQKEFSDVFWVDKSKSTAYFYFAYKTFIPDVFSFYMVRDPNQIAWVEYSVPNVPCVHYTDFTSLFDHAPQEVKQTSNPPANSINPSKHINYVKYTFEKDIPSNFQIKLTAAAVNSCVEYIDIGMIKKSDSNP